MMPTQYSSLVQIASMTSWLQVCTTVSQKFFSSFPIGQNGLNQLINPNGVYLDYLYTNSLYVVDAGNNRILRFPMN